MGNKKEKSYIVLYYRNADEEVIIDRMTVEEMREKLVPTHGNEFAVIDGDLIKSFDSHWRGLH